MMLLELALHFGLLSLISIGGMLSVIPEMHRYVVDVKRWITPGDFIQMFAIGQAAPGPNVLITGLIGWKTDGVAGALVALGAIVAFWVAGLWERMKDSPWRAMAPIVVGLVFSGGFVLATPGCLRASSTPCGSWPPVASLVGCFSRMIPFLFSGQTHSCATRRSNGREPRSGPRR